MVMMMNIQHLEAKSTLTKIRKIKSIKTFEFKYSDRRKKYELIELVSLVVNQVVIDFNKIKVYVTIKGCKHG